MECTGDLTVEKSYILLLNQRIIHSKKNYCLTKYEEGRFAYCTRICSTVL